MGLRDVLERFTRLDPRELLFRVSVWLKGLDGVLELAGGAALLAVGPAVIARVIHGLTEAEITEDPRDLVANYLRQSAAHLSMSGEHFIAYYLLIHGVVKLALVWGLLGRVLVTYPVALVVFTLFVAYQIYRYTLAPGWGLIALTAFDLAIIVFVYLEYRALRRRRTSS